MRRLAQLEEEMNAMREKHQLAERELEKTKGEAADGPAARDEPRTTRSNAAVDAKNQAFNIPSLAELGTQEGVPHLGGDGGHDEAAARGCLERESPGGSVDGTKLAELEAMNDRLRTELLMMSLMRLEITHLGVTNEASSARWVTSRDS